MKRTNRRPEITAHDIGNLKHRIIAIHEAAVKHDTVSARERIRLDFDAYYQLENLRKDIDALIGQERTPRP
jgi:hypothetical protein